MKYSIFYNYISGEFTKEEKIEIVNTIKEDDFVELAFKVIPCKHFKGDILLRSRMNCSKVWCNGTREILVSMEANKPNKIWFNNLFAYTRYNLTVDRSRNKEYWENVYSGQVKTSIGGKYLIVLLLNGY